MDIKQQIFKELDALEKDVANLHSVAKNAGQQTDLEVAILTKQVRDLRDRQEKADALIEKSIGILNKLTPNP
jgi:hypothetical protein